MGKRSLSPYVDGSLRRGVTSRKFREDPAHSFVDRSTRTNIFTQRGAILSCLSIVPGIDERHDVVHHGVTRTRVSMLQPRLNAPLQGRVAVYGGRLRIDDIFPLSSWTFAFFFFFLSFAYLNLPIFFESGYRRYRRSQWINESSLTASVYPSIARDV